METIFSTSTVHPRDRFDCWHSLVCRTLLNNEATPECRATFGAAIKMATLAEIGLVQFEHSPMSFWYNADNAARANPDDVFFCRKLIGKVALEQEGREAELGPGDLALIDPRSPYAGRSYGDSSMLILKIPRQLLESRVGKLTEASFRAIRATSADARLTSSFLATLAHAGGLSRAAEEIVKNHTLDLIALALAQFEGRRPSPSSARSLVLTKVRAAIEARLADPDLDAESVAAAAGVSKRQANDVLAEQSLSISRLIQARRLARCRSALDDPLQIHRTVSEIAYSWGFSDMTHFGRRFRAAYGSLPSDYRKGRRTAD